MNRIEVELSQRAQERGMPTGGESDIESDDDDSIFGGDPFDPIQCYLGECVMPLLLASDSDDGVDREQDDVPDFVGPWDTDAPHQDVYGMGRLLKRAIQDPREQVGTLGVSHQGRPGSVLVHVAAYTEDGSCIDSRSLYSGRPIRLIRLENGSLRRTGFGNCFDGLILCLRVGERALFYRRAVDTSASKGAHKYCVFDVEYVGSDESYEDSAASTDIGEEGKSSSAEAPEALLEVCNQMRVAGNLSFKIGGFMEAATLYQEAIGYLDHTDHPLRIKLHNNAAASFLSAGESSDNLHRVIKLTTYVLQQNASDSKALYRRATAFFQLGELASAKRDAISACKAEPSSKRIRKLLKQVKAAAAAQRKKEQAMFGGMFT